MNGTAQCTLHIATDSNWFNEHDGTVLNAPWTLQLILTLLTTHSTKFTMLMFNDEQGNVAMSDTAICSQPTSTQTLVQKVTLRYNAQISSSSSVRKSWRAEQQFNDPSPPPPAMCSACHEKPPTSAQYYCINSTNILTTLLNNHRHHQKIS